MLAAWTRVLAWCALVCLAFVVPAPKAFAAPGDTLFFDDFERASLPPWTASSGTNSGIATGTDVSNSGTRGGFTRYGVVTVTSPTIGASVPGAELSLWVRRGSDAFSEDPDGGEDLVVEYLDSSFTWNPITTYPGAGTAGQIFQDTLTLPPAALHGGLQIRFRQAGGSGNPFDWWHFDDVRVTETVAATPLMFGDCDDFESGLTNWTVASSGGAAGASAATSNSPSNSMFLNGGVVSVTSIPIDTNDPFFNTVTVWIRRGADAFSENPDGGENLVVEYRDSGGSFNTIETLTGAGTQGQIFARTYNLPVDARHANFQMRFRMTGGSGTAFDFWHVDDVCLPLPDLPDLVVTKGVTTISDPTNGTSNPKAIPGATVRYAVTVTNVGAGSVDAGTLVVTDALAGDLEAYVDTAGGDPVAFVDGAPASGLGFTYATDVSWSDQPGGGAPFDYVPSPDADGFDAAVTGLRIQPSGSMAGSGGGGDPSFRLEFRARVR